jgi:hypothetical protein
MRHVDDRRIEAERGGLYGDGVRELSRDDRDTRYPAAVQIDEVVQTARRA